MILRTIASNPSAPAWLKGIHKRLFNFFLLRANHRVANHNYHLCPCRHPASISAKYFSNYSFGAIAFNGISEFTGSDNAHSNLIADALQQK